MNRNRKDLFCRKEGLALKMVATGKLAMPYANQSYRRLTLFLMILLSGGSMLFPRVPMLLLASVLGLLATKFRIIEFRKAKWIWAILLLIMTLSLIRPGSIDISSSIIRYANFAAGLILLNTYLFSHRGTLQKDLFWLLGWMSIQALATFLIANVASFLFSTIQVNGASQRTLLLVLNYHDLLETGGLKRPDGFFFEPGIYQIYLNIYLYLALVVYRRTRESLLALGAVFSTQSTTGMVISLFILLIEVVRRFNNTTIRRKIQIGLLATIILPPLLYIGFLNVNEKISGELRGSTMAREYDLYTGLNIIAQYPILGIGFSHSRYLDLAQRNSFVESQLSAEGMEERPTTNGLVYLYYSLGIPMGSLLLIALFRQQLFHHRFLIGIALFLSLFGEAIIFTPFILMIIFSAFMLNKYQQTPLKY
jgi:hypothetical protein